MTWIPVEAAAKAAMSCRFQLSASVEMTVFTLSVAASDEAALGFLRWHKCLLTEVI
jgi:hypothetical protein